MKLIYKPFAIVVGLLAGILSKKAFEKVWGAIADEDPLRSRRPRRDLDRGPDLGARSAA